MANNGTAAECHPVQQAADIGTALAVGIPLAVLVAAIIAGALNRYAGQSKTLSSFIIDQAELKPISPEEDLDDSDALTDFLSGDFMVDLTYRSTHVVAVPCLPVRSPSGELAGLKGPHSSRASVRVRSRPQRALLACTRCTDLWALLCTERYRSAGAPDLPRMI